MINARRVRSFTLIELMVVAVLMTLASGILVTHLDDFTDRGRLRAAASQTAAVLHLATTRAKASGVPVRVTYDINGDRVRMAKPVLRDGRWIWDEQLEWSTATGVRIDRVLVEGRVDAESFIRVDAGGRYPSHAVVFSLHNKYVAVIAEPWRRARVLFFDDPEPVQDYNTLRSKLETDRASP